MPPPLTSEQALALAPDSSVASSGQKLARPKDWKSLGRGERAAWGECQGSALYQVRVDLSDLTPSCSCPSRKLPCKHCIGLLLLLAGEQLPETAVPEWVETWLAKRGAAAERKAAKRAAPVADVTDEAKPKKESAAKTKRAAERQERITRGLEAFGRWMEDLVRGGLSGLDSADAVHEQAARLVDAEAPGLAAQVRRFAEDVEGKVEPRRRVERLGRLALLLEAWKRREQLPEPLRADLQTCVGAPLREEEIFARGERVQDTWAVVSQELDETTNVREQRTWLLGRDTGRTALVLQFAAGPGATFADKFLPGTAFAAELVYWPSAAPQRAKVSQRHGDVHPWRGPLPSVSIQGLHQHFTGELARQPFQEHTAALLGAVTPLLMKNEQRWLRDATGAAILLDSTTGWRLLALSGGHPVDVFGEWDGERLRPLSLLLDGHLHPLPRATV